MAKPNNKDKKPIIDESVLDETPPNINEPQAPTEEIEPEVSPTEEPAEKVDEPEVVETPPEVKTEVPSVVEETPEEKEKKYRSQQTEAQIQAAKAKALSDKVTEASNLPEPTEDELRAYVTSKGASYDDLTPFEQSMARDSFISRKQFNLVNEAVQTTKKIDEWATKVDTFIDSTDGKPEYVILSGHEADFRKFCMKESHRGVDIEVLLPAFLHNLPKVAPKRGGLFETGGGGEAQETKPGEITDADQVAQLRQTNPREYARQLKAGKIKIEV